MDKILFVCFAVACVCVGASPDEDIEKESHYHHLLGSEEGSHYNHALGSEEGSHYHHALDSEERIHYHHGIGSEEQSHYNHAIDSEEQSHHRHAIGSEERSHHHHGIGSEERKHHHHKAYSFMHFHGPVHGHHKKVTWKDKHWHKHHDFVAHPKYKFSYGVKDHHTHDFHGQTEYRDGKKLHGEYHIHEPGGNMRTVKYYADPHGGFFAHVHNHGGNDHSGYGRR